MLNPWVLFGLAVAWASSVGGAFFFGRTTGQDACIAETARDEQVAVIASEAAASATAAAISQIKVQHRTVTQEVRREVLEREVYRDAHCRHSDEQLRRLNEALTGRRAEPLGGRLVPRSDAAGGRGLRLDDREAGGSGGDLPRMP